MQNRPVSPVYATSHNRSANPRKRLSVLYPSIQIATAWRACSRVVKWLGCNNSHSRVELNASLTALSSAEPVRPMDWVTPAQRHACTNKLAVYSLPWSV